MPDLNRNRLSPGPFADICDPESYADFGPDPLSRPKPYCLDCGWHTPNCVCATVPPHAN